jgi:hypothetical protein
MSDHSPFFLYQCVAKSKSGLLSVVIYEDGGHSTYQ